MQTVLVANVRSFPPSFCCVSLSHCFFPSAPLVTPGKQDICDDETSKQDF